MTEQLANVSLSEAQTDYAYEIMRAAQQSVTTEYGSGLPVFAPGTVADLAYHNGHHTAAVPRDARRVGQALDLSNAELLTIDLAGWAHDIIQLKPRGVMEAESAEWLETQMYRAGLPAAMIEAASLAVKGTEPLFSGGYLTGQVATQLDYPSESAAEVAMSVACGDFGELYTPHGPYLSHKLYQEIKGVGPNQEPPLEGLADYERGQIALRQNYNYPVSDAYPVLATHMSQVMAYGEAVLRQLERGDITSWAQLEAMDLAFMRAAA